MVMTSTRIKFGLIAGLFAAAVAAWWFVYEPPLGSDAYYDREAFPEFELTFDGIPLGSELRWQPHWVVVARAIPPAKNPDTRFLALVAFHSPHDDTTGLGDVTLTQQQHDSPGFPLRAMQNGEALDLTPPMLSREDPRIQLCGLMQPSSAFAQYEADVEDVVNTPLMLHVWMYPLDENGIPRFEEGILVHRQDVEIVR